MERQLRYIAVEGPIGVGKTALAELLARRLQARLVLEGVGENPFLEKFYRDMRGYAFQTQLFFLLSRYRQLRETFQTQMVVVGGALVPGQVVVSDYLFEKDRIFATLNLTDDELSLYYRVYDLVKQDVPQPDMVIYLQARVDILLARIKQRGRKFEENIDPEYLKNLSNFYNSFFLHYEAAPVLIVNTDRLDFVGTSEDFEGLFRAMLEHEKGRRFYSPRGRRK